MTQLTPSQFDSKALEAIRLSVDVIAAEAARAYNYLDARVLDIGPQGKDYASKLFTRAKYDTFDISDEHKPTHVGDLCDNKSENGVSILCAKYDAILCFEVLEHVNQPFLAVNNLKYMLKPGGMLYLTTPFNFRIHNPLPDNWRFTEHGLRQLFSDGWHILDIQTVESIYVEAPSRPLMPVHYRLWAKKI